MFTFVIMMKIQSWYQAHFRSELSGRYICNDHIIPLLDSARDFVRVEDIGSSENGLPIHSVKLGTGPTKVLGWSQMHGNESTTTKALFDLLKMMLQKEVLQEEIKAFLGNYTFVFVPILNPDGALAYTRENANGIDLNRDAMALSQLESRVLSELIDEVQPDFCLNLHDQRTIYGTEEGKPATVSFLAPAADPDRNVTSARKLAMEQIVRMRNRLELLIPGQVARYDDSFNINCVGDRCSKAGIPTILFEAGHFPGDYERENTRELIFYAFLTFFGITDGHQAVAEYKEYFLIPENRVNYKDVIIRNVRVEGYPEVVSVAIQYKEILLNGKISFESIVDTIGDLDDCFAHNENDGNKGIALLNYQEKAGIGEKILTIITKNSQNTLFDSRDLW